MAACTCKFVKGFSHPGWLIVVVNLYSSASGIIWVPRRNYVIIFISHLPYLPKVLYEVGTEYLYRAGEAIQVDPQPKTNGS